MKSELKAGTVHISTKESGLNLYQHQRDAIYELDKQVIKSEKNPFAGMVVLPTGGGKTLTAGYWICQNYLDKGKKVLWLAHRHELLDQALRTFQYKLAYKDIFRNKNSFNFRLLSSIHSKPPQIKPTDDIIISTVASLQNETSFKFLCDNFLSNTDELLVVVDEAHHTTAKTYRHLITKIRGGKIKQETYKPKVKNFKLIGLTATPERTVEEEKKQLSYLFPDGSDKHKGFVYEIGLTTLISRGILSTPKFLNVDTNYNFTNELTEKQIEKLNNQKFDINSIGGNVAYSIATNTKRNTAIVNEYLKYRKTFGQTLVFSLNIDNAIALNKLFNVAGIRSDFLVSGIVDDFGKKVKIKDPKIVLEKFRNKEVEVLINVNILTEGTDVPDIQTVFLARPTTSKIMMTQMVGRGLRGELAGGTKETYIVNFIDDDPNERINWVNPELQYIEEVDFTDRNSSKRPERILISVAKIEEFAVLAGKIINPEIREEIEKLSFYERFPLGFFIVKDNMEDDETATATRKWNNEILVYCNMEKSYKNFIDALPNLFKKHKIDIDDDKLEPSLLNKLALEVEDRFFYGIPKYPAFDAQDLKNILQYYFDNKKEPRYYTFDERDKFGTVIQNIAKEIREKDLTQSQQENLFDKKWEEYGEDLQLIFGNNKLHYLSELDNEIRRLRYSKEYEKNQVKLPITVQEQRKYEDLRMWELREIAPNYEKDLRDTIFNNHKDAETGKYYCVNCNSQSKNRKGFEIDHIKSMHKGGKTVLENLQVLCIKCNRIKGAN